jgi:hypothetical protein
VKQRCVYGIKYIIGHSYHVFIPPCTPILFSPDSSTIFNLSPCIKFTLSHIPPTCLHTWLALLLRNNEAKLHYSTPHPLCYVTIQYLHLISYTSTSHHIRFFLCSPPYVANPLLQYMNPKIMTAESAGALAVGFDSQPLPSMIADQKTVPKGCIRG